MTDKRSLIVFGQVHEAEQKFDYFVTGLTGALCGYIAEGYAATKVGLNDSTLELVAILILIVSFWLGFKRIQWGIVVKQLNAFRLDSLEKKGDLTVNFQGGPLVNEGTGDVYLPDTVLKLIQAHGSKASAFQKALDVANKKARLCCDWRNRCLFAGFIVLLIAKVAGAYT